MAPPRSAVTALAPANDRLRNSENATSGSAATRVSWMTKEPSSTPAPVSRPIVWAVSQPVVPACSTA